MKKPERLVFYTTAGLEVEYEPVSPILLEESEKGLEREYRQRGEPIDPPTYTVELAGSTPEQPLTQTFPHDETTLRTDADRAAWTAYKDARERLTAEQAQLRLEMVLSALHVSLPDDDAWVQRYKRWHIQVPDDPQERLIFYIQREVLKTPEDIFNAMTAVITASMRGSVTEEAIAAASATFRNQLQEALVEAGIKPGEDRGDTPA